LTPRAPPFEISEGHRNRHGSNYDFLLTFYHNHGPNSFRFRDNGDFIREPQILPTPGVFKALAEGKLGTLEIRYRRSE